MLFEKETGPIVEANHTAQIPVPLVFVHELRISPATGLSEKATWHLFHMLHSPLFVIHVFKKALKSMLDCKEVNEKVSYPHIVRTDLNKNVSTTLRKSSL